MPLQRLLLLLIAPLFLAACGGGHKAQPLPAGAAVLAFGDSVTFGTGAAPGEDYPTRLAAITGWTITNAGIPGDTTEAARGRIRAALEQSNPALVIVELGGNDFLRRRPEKQIKEDLRKILATVRAARIPVVLVAVPRFSLLGAVVGALPDAELYEQLAEEEKVPLVPKVFGRILADPGLKADQIHPNAEGYRQLADGIAEGLRKAGFLAR
ncbi:arylesterase [Sulfurisoma sediminicola]|uniref:Acyl-CoA hydrolase n=1 Tax=Sulfurisoma sediminicola TaxID=1381557 RepID=A0A497XDE1_9PROT|nr:arylesterase [Sulfurisoma sediminicola]RLJ64709.1 acyl-CoA hydrolase [Sulfurisoma sediminicola]